MVWFTCSGTSPGSRPPPRRSSAVETEIDTVTATLIEFESGALATLGANFVTAPLFTLDLHGTEANAYFRVEQDAFPWGRSDLLDENTIFEIQRRGAADREGVPVSGGDVLREELARFRPVYPAGGGGGPRGGRTRGARGPGRRPGLLRIGPHGPGRRFSRIYPVTKNPAGISENVRMLGQIDLPGGGQEAFRNGVAYVGHMDPRDGAILPDVSDAKNQKVLCKPLCFNLPLSAR